MQARRGDRIIVYGHKVGTPARTGKVLRGGSSMLSVRWDDGRESFFTPASDCRVLPSTPDDDQPDDEVDRFGTHIELRVSEDRDGCEAVATLMTSRGAFEGRGDARRHPSDPPVPMIGEELAIGRALRNLGEGLIDEAEQTSARSEMPAAHLLV